MSQLIAALHRAVNALRAPTAGEEESYHLFKDNHMRVERLPPHWQEWLKSYHPQTDGELRASDFKTDRVVRLQFEDGSLAIFNYSFYVIDEARKEIAVFTEHCGYHVFDLPGLRYEALAIQWQDKETV